jgi:multidrug efflux system membrane fusion protein
VVFALSENQLPRVRRSMQDGGNPTVEAWNRDMTAKIATGRLAAIDNQIDPATGTVKLKADFDNKDGALFPKLFVNVRLYLNGAR